MRAKFAFEYYVEQAASTAADAADLRAARARLGDAAGLGDAPQRPEHPQ